jgi:cytochrome c oxidase subunit IV
MGHSYESSKKIALKTIIVLAVVTVIEVLIALSGKGYLFNGALVMPWYIMNFLMIGFSLYKAYLIVGEFMHLAHEVKSMAMSIVLPMFLLFWAIIAFMYEGNAWKGNREVIQEKNRLETESSMNTQGMLLETDTKQLDEK